MAVVALTGGIACGKTTVANGFAQLGIDIIDADLIAREITTHDDALKTKIIAHFGPSIVRNDGSIDRKKIRSIIFHNKNERLWLEQLLHPHITAIAEAAIKAAKGPYCIYVIPLLVETYSTNPRFHRILVVDIPVTLQIQRLMHRDSLSEGEARDILSNQASREERLAIADDIIVNDDDIIALTAKIHQLHQQYVHQAIQ